MNARRCSRGALNTEYADAIDADRLEEWPGLFLEQCLYKITTADNHARGLPPAWSMPTRARC